MAHFRSLLLPLALVLGACAASASAAEPFARHVGQQDPLSQGWSQHPSDAPTAGVSFGAQAPDADDLPSWFVNDASTASGSRWRYQVAPFSSADRSEGWTLRGKLRVAALSDANDGSILLDLGDGARRWTLSFGSTASGSTTVKLWSDGRTASVSTPTPGATGYHLFELAHDPIAGVADLYVDGVLVLANDTGVASSLDRLDFGSGQSSTTGHGRFALVELRLGPQACRDGLDDDGDGLVDFAGGDPDCTSPRDPHEEGAFDSDFDGASDADEALAGSDPLRPDTDGDGLGDRFEIAFGLDPLVAGDAAADSDGDGLSDAAEEAAGSDPHLVDSDADGLTDADEVSLYASNPSASDSDGDGLPDAEEVNVTGTSPAKADTDGDGLSDAEELGATGTDPVDSDSDGDGLADGREVNDEGTDPLVADSDGDGLADGAEVFEHGTDPLLADTDGDGLGDAFEVEGGLDPQVAGEQSQDPDADGLTNLEEQAAGSDPQLADSDGDGLGDADEVNLHGTSPRQADSDGDTLTDAWEVANGLDPLSAADALADADVDGLTSLSEQALGTDPQLADSDADGVPDGDEVNILGSDPLDPTSAGAAVASSSTLVFDAVNQPLFPAQVSAPTVFPVVSDSYTGQQGQIVTVNQQVPLWAAQQAWDQAVATCDATNVRFDDGDGIPDFCGDLVISPSESQCIEGGTIDLSPYSVSCCNDFGDYDNGCGIFGSTRYTLEELEALPGVSGVPSSYDVGPGIGPRPTQPPPPEPFDVGVVVTQDVSVEGVFEMTADAQDGGLVDVSYGTQASLRADRSTVAAGDTFVLQAVHRPDEQGSSMASLWPAASFTLGYEFDVSALVQVEYASIDPSTGNQVHQTFTALDEQVTEAGELIGFRLGLFEGFEMRFMNGVDYAPEGYRDVVWQILAPPSGLGIDFGFTQPPTCPSLALELTPACAALPNAPLSVDLSEMRYQIPELNSPASDDYAPGVVALNSSTLAEPLRGAIRSDGALVNTMPGRYRPATNFTNDSNLLDMFFSDASNLSADYGRFGVDLDGLLALASGGVFLSGVNIADPAGGIFDLSVDALDSDVVTWFGYDQDLSFAPNLVADVRFDKEVEVYDAAQGTFVTLPAGQTVTLAASVAGGSVPQALLDLGIPAQLEVRQPPGGVQVDVTYSFRENRFTNETYELATVAWQNTFFQLSLDGLVFDSLEEAGLPLTFAAVRTTLSGFEPAQGPRKGSSDPFVGVSGSDFAGTPFTVLDLSADADADGIPDALESVGCTSALDADSDDDGLGDGVEDANRNGLVDAGETSPCLADTDGDTMQDGTERGLLTATPDPDGAGPLLGTDLGAFVPSPDPTQTSDPTDASDPLPAAVPAVGLAEWLAAMLGIATAAAFARRPAGRDGIG